MSHWIEDSENYLSLSYLHLFFDKLNLHSYDSLCSLSRMCVDSYHSNSILYVNSEAHKFGKSSMVNGYDKV